MNLNKTKDKLQQKILKKVIQKEGWGILALATGVGKSRIAVLYADKIVSEKPDAKILVVVPTEKLRDENWKNEFVDWGYENIWKHNVERACYVSINKLYHKEYDLVILDEIQNITPNNSKFFDQNRIDRCLGLTATLPTDIEKKEILQELNLNPIFEVTMDEAVKLGLIAPYKIKVVYVELNNKDKYIPAGNKNKPFMTTEKAQYDYLSSLVEKHKYGDYKKYQSCLFMRMRFLYNIRTKTDAAKWILDNVIKEDERVLIFCGSIEQSERVSKYFFHSKSGNIHFQKFQNKEINRLSCVQALNEGMNITDLDTGLIVQLNSKNLTLIQRIGRILRYREEHEGMVYILTVKDTVDEEWTRKALIGFNPKNIEYVNF